MDYMYMYINLRWIICIYAYIDGLYVYVQVSQMDYMYIYIHTQMYPVYIFMHLR